MAPIAGGVVEVDHRATEGTEGTEKDNNKTVVDFDAWNASVPLRGLRGSVVKGRWRLGLLAALDVALSLTLFPVLATAQEARTPDFDALGFEAAERLGEY